MIGSIIKGGGSGKAKVSLGNVKLGTNAGIKLSSDDDDNVAIGTNALNSTTTDSNDNVAIGTDAGTAITTGDDNICIGNGSGASLTDGSRNISIGHDANNAEGSLLDSVFIGTENCAAGGGNNMVSIGSKSLKLSTGTLTNTTLVGSSTGDASAGAFEQSTYVGYGVLSATSVSGTASQYDTFLGTQVCGSGQYQASANTIIGYRAGLNKTTGNHNTLIGSDCGSSMTAESQCNIIGYYGHFNFAHNEGYRGMQGLGNFGTGLQFNSQTVTMSTYNAAQGDDNTAASVAIIRIPQYSVIYRVMAFVSQKGAGTHKYSLSLGTASDEAIGDTVAGRVEILGANVGTGIATRSSATKDSATDIDASTGATAKAVWVSEMSPGTNNFTGWCDSDMYLYVTNAGIGNSESDPGTDPQVHICVYYWGRD